MSVSVEVIVVVVNTGAGVTVVYRCQPPWLVVAILEDVLHDTGCHFEAAQVVLAVRARAV